MPEPTKPVPPALRDSQARVETGGTLGASSQRVQTSRDSIAQADDSAGVTPDAGGDA